MDLQGHSAKNRLPIFFYKPAPIQASWLGQGSTGISEIDYFIGSPHITPKDEETPCSAPCVMKYMVVSALPYPSVVRFIFLLSLP